jgi:hypothetical protein
MENIMQYSLSTVDNPVVQKVLGGSNEGLGIHKSSKSVHPNLTGLHRNDSGSNCFTVVSVDERMYRPVLNEPYRFSLWVSKDDEGISIMHSDQYISNMDSKGDVFTFIIDGEDISNKPQSDMPSVSIESEIKMLRKGYSRFCGWAVFDIVIQPNGDFQVDKIRNHKGGIIFEDGKYTNIAARIIPWEHKTPEERIVVLSTPYSYISDEFSESIKEIAYKNLSLSDSTIAVGKVHSKIQKEIMLSIKAEEMRKKEETKSQKSGSTKGKSDGVKNVRRSDTVKSFLGDFGGIS